MDTRMSDKVWPGKADSLVSNGRPCSVRSSKSARISFYTTLNAYVYGWLGIISERSDLSGLKARCGNYSEWERDRGSDCRFASICHVSHRHTWACIAALALHTHFNMHKQSQAYKRNPAHTRTNVALTALYALSLIKLSAVKRLGRYIGEWLWILYYCIVKIEFIIDRL